MDTHYGILEYTESNFFNYISYKTKSSYQDISKKQQIKYLANYLTYHTKSQEKIFFIYENEYVDQHYLDDYSAYYSKCFYPYDKTCARIHFFVTDKKDISSFKLREELSNALDKHQSIVCNDNYLGFIVIRPIPKTFLAKVCIKPTKNDESPDKKLLRRKYKTSLFGIDLEVNTVAFQEQEKILSACATTALWSFYHAHPNMHNGNLPSGYMITKSAYNIEGGHDSEFPNKGLSTDMICRSMKKYGLSPKEYDMKDKNNQYLKEYLYAYNIQKIPAIYGVNVKNEKNDLHAITVLGYTLNDLVLNYEDEIPLLSHNIHHIHVHDDRYGAFLRIELNDNTVTIRDKKDTYTPNTLILGIDQSVRIDYLQIRKFCETFRERISLALTESMENASISGTSFQRLLWDIKLKKVNDLKSTMLEKNIYNKMMYQIQSWPKYIWSAVAKGDKCQFEILFDATNIEQGKIFLGILYNNDDISLGIKNDFEIYFKDIYPIEEMRTEIFDEIQLFMQNKIPYPLQLNKEFGTLCMPVVIKATEIENDEVLENRLLTICNSINIDNKPKTMNDLYDKEYDLIWLINSHGCLIIGNEKKGSQQGHPSLIGGEAARIGGEIKKESDNEWVVNPFSGRYSDEYTSDEKKEYIKNVINYKLEPSFPDDKFTVADIKN